MYPNNGIAWTSLNEPHVTPLVYLFKKIISHNMIDNQVILEFYKKNYT